MRCLATAIQILNDIVEPNNRNHLYSKLFEFLYCGQVSQPLFLTVELYPYIDDPDGAASEAYRYMCALFAKLDLKLD